jgi:uncharacterized integral membrane protein
MSDQAPEQQDAPAEEGRFRRGVRYTHHTAMFVAVAIVVATILYLVLLIASNTRRVKLDYVFGSGHARLIWLIVLSAFTGWLLGLATSFLFRRRMRRTR